MYVRTNARRNIVEATDSAQGSEYINVPGTVAANLPDGLLGFNGAVYTPNYSLVDGSVVARSAEEKALDPYSDETPTAEDYEEAYKIVTGEVE